MKRIMLTIVLGCFSLASRSELISAEDVDCNRVQAVADQARCFREKRELKEFKDVRTTSVKEDKLSTEEAIAKYSALSDKLKDTHDKRRRDLEREMNVFLKENPNIGKVLTSSMAWERDYYHGVAGMIKKNNKLICDEFSSQTYEHRDLIINDAAIYFVEGDLRNYISIQFKREADDHDIPELYLNKKLPLTVGAKMQDGTVQKLEYVGKFRVESSGGTKQTDMRLERGKNYRADFSAGTKSVIVDLVCLPR